MVQVLENLVKAKVLVRPQARENLAEGCVEQEKCRHNGEGQAHGSAASLQNQDRQQHGADLVKTVDPLAGIPKDFLVNQNHVAGAHHTDHGQHHVVPRHRVRLFLLVRRHKQEQHGQHKEQMHASLHNIRKHAEAGGVKLEQHEHNGQGRHHMPPKAGKFSHFLPSYCITAQPETVGP